MLKSNVKQSPRKYMQIDLQTMYNMQIYAIYIQTTKKYNMEIWNSFTNNINIYINIKGSYELNNKKDLIKTE